MKSKKRKKKEIFTKEIERILKDLDSITFLASRVSNASRAYKNKLRLLKRVPVADKYDYRDRKAAIDFGDRINELALAIQSYNTNLDKALDKDEKREGKKEYSVEEAKEEIANLVKNNKESVETALEADKAIK